MDYCEPCKEEGRGVIVAHYGAVPASKSHTGQRIPAKCYDHQHGLPVRTLERPRPAPMKPEMDETTQEYVAREKPLRNQEVIGRIEHTKIGDLPKYVCGCQGQGNCNHAPGECRERRSGLDCSGICRPCKEAQGLAPRRLPRLGPPPVTAVEPPADNRVSIDGETLTALFQMFTAERRAAALELVWAELPDALKLKLVKSAAQVVRQQACNS